MKNNAYKQALDQIVPEKDFELETLKKLDEASRPKRVFKLRYAALVACALVAALVIPRLIPKNLTSNTIVTETPAPVVTPLPASEPVDPEAESTYTFDVNAVADNLRSMFGLGNGMMASSRNDAYTNADVFAYSEPGMVEYEAGALFEAGYYDDFNTNEFSAISENGYRSVLTSPLSTFAADVDTASYTVLRRALLEGNLPDSEAIRIEEMINYFEYMNLAPEDGAPCRITASVAACPWNEKAALMFVGVGAQAIESDVLPPSNLVFLVDTSGSMDSADRLGLIKQAFALLTECLRPQDTVSIVTYASCDRVMLEGVTGDKRAEIIDAVDEMTAWGSTNGSSGIITAYELAQRYFIEGGNNRVILMTDGDLNVGTTSTSELTKLIKEKKETGVFLSVFGFGMGNYKDDRLESLADNGNGTYAYVDSLIEAKRALVDQIGAGFYTVCKDVKLQVEFNPALVDSYRLVGYENRQLAAEDFADDTKDGGEMGSGHTVVALYELIPTEGASIAGITGGAKSSTAVELKYQTSVSTGSDELATVNVRYKAPDSDTSALITKSVMPDAEAAYTDMRNMQLASAVAEFGLLLRNSEYKGSASYEHCIGLVQSLDLPNADETELAYLMTRANQISK